MLVLSRKTKERFRIGPDIWVSIERIGPNNVKVGIEAPAHLNILREELTAHTSQDAGEGTEARGE